MDTNSQAIRIARRIRRRCERFVMSDAAREYDFHMSPDLHCMCAVASFALAEALREHNIKCRVVRGLYYLFFDKESWHDYRSRNIHCWVTVGQTVIDITATQFDDLPKVHVTTTRDKHYRKIRTVDYRDMHDWDRQKPSRPVSKQIMGRIGLVKI